MLIEQLQQENNQLKSVLDEVREYIEKTRIYVDKITKMKHTVVGEDLLQILDKAKGSE